MHDALVVGLDDGADRRQKRAHRDVGREAALARERPAASDSPCSTSITMYGSPGGREAEVEHAHDAGVAEARRGGPAW